MKFYHYRWNTKYGADDPRVSGVLDDTVLDRMDGWQVLYFVNQCAFELWNEPSPMVFGLFERALRCEIPGDIRKQAEVKRWLQDNGYRYIEQLR